MSFVDWLKSIPQGLQGIDRFTAVFAAAAGAVTDGKMWRSLGWLLLGLVLVVVAILWLMRKPLEHKAQQAAQLAPLAL